MFLCCELSKPDPSVRRPLERMRRLFALVCFSVLTACPSQPSPTPPPMGQFYFPTGLAHVDSAQAPDGILFVASGNFDKRYGAGSLQAVNLSAVNPPLPAFGAPVNGVPVAITDLGVTDAGLVSIASFAGEVGAVPVTDGGYRLFIPTRSEGMKVMAIDAPALAAGAAPLLVCFTDAGVSDRDCGTNATSLDQIQFSRSTSGVPRAPSPFGVAWAPRGCFTDDDCYNGTCSHGQCLVMNRNGQPELDNNVFVTALQQTDSPYLSGLNLRGYLTRLSSATPDAIDAGSFINIGPGGASGVVTDGRWVYFSGRYVSPAGSLLRAYDTDGGAVYTSALESNFYALDARAIGRSTDGSHLFIVTRVPDMLLTVSVHNGNTSAPTLRVEHSVSLPDSPNELVVLPRAGRSDLVAVVGVGNNTVAFYDDALGQVVGHIGAVGLQPFGIAADLKGPGARLYVSSYQDGRVVVIDVPDLDRPQDGRIVAYLGASQQCILLNTCVDGGTQ